MGTLLVIECGTQKVRLDFCEVADNLEFVRRGVDDVDPCALFERLERQSLQGAALKGLEDFEHRQGVSFRGSSPRSNAGCFEKKEASKRFLFICRATRVISVHFLTSFP